MKRKDAKEKEWNKRHASGRVRLTVTGQYYSFSSQWLVTDCLCYTPKIRQGDKHQSSTHPRPLTRHFPFSNFIFNPVKPVLHYYQHFSYFTLSKWHLLVVVVVVVRWSISAPRVVVSFTAWWGQTDSYELKVGSCSPCWRWTGLLHLLWEADCGGEEGEVGWWGKDWGRRETSY